MDGSSFENQKREREIDALHQFRWEPTINNHWTGAKLSQQRRVPLERGQTDARCSDTILTSAIPVPIQPVKVIESEIIEVWRRRVEGASWSKIEKGEKRKRKKEGRKDGRWREISGLREKRGDGRRRIERREMISIGSLRRPCKRIIGQ